MSPVEAEIERIGQHLAGEVAPGCLALSRAVIRSLLERLPLAQQRDVIVSCAREHRAACRRGRTH